MRVLNNNLGIKCREKYIGMACLNTNDQTFKILSWQASLKCRTEQGKAEISELLSRGTVNCSGKSDGDNE